LYDYDAAAGSPDCLVAPEPGEVYDDISPAPTFQHANNGQDDILFGQSGDPESLGGLARSLYSEIVRATLAAYERPKSVSRLAESVYDDVLGDILIPDV